MKNLCNFDEKSQSFLPSQVGKYAYIFVLIFSRARYGEDVDVRPLFFYFLVYGFLGRKNGSVGRKKKKKKIQIIK